MEDDFEKKIHTFNAEEEINVIINFLEEAKLDAERLKLLLKEMKILEKYDMLKQVEKFHEILKFYQLLDTDVGINAERIKKISSNLKNKALESNDLTDEWKEIIKTNERWNFDW